MISRHVGTKRLFSRFGTHASGAAMVCFGANYVQGSGTSTRSSYFSGALRRASIWRVTRSGRLSVAGPRGHWLGSVVEAGCAAPVGSWCVLLLRNVIVACAMPGNSAIDCWKSSKLSRCNFGKSRFDPDGEGCATESFALLKRRRAARSR
jgi:hypothetical protein